MLLLTISYGVRALIFHLLFSHVLYTVTNQQLIPLFLVLSLFNVYLVNCQSSYILYFKNIIVYIVII